MNRAVTIKCITCGLEITGVEREGKIYSHNTARPELDAPKRNGYCSIHAPKGSI